MKINDNIHEYHLLGEIWPSKWLIWYFTLLFLQEITLKWLWTTITVFPMLIQYYWDTRAFWGSPDPQRFSIFQAKTVQRIITKPSLLCSWQNFWQIHGRKKIIGPFFFDLWMFKTLRGSDDPRLGGWRLIKKLLKKLNWSTFSKLIWQKSIAYYTYCSIF